MTDSAEAPEHDQFMTKVEKTDSCWVWKGAKSKNGYGRFRSMSAHRFSYEAHIGEIHPDMTIDHICRNTSCVNPDHLRQLTQYQNNMLGNGFTAVNRRKTHCINGHALSGDNIVIIERSDGTRRKCKVCEREQKRRYRKEKKMKRTDAYAEVTPEMREGVIDQIEQTISDTHDVDTTDRHYAERVFDECIECISGAISLEMDHARKQAHAAGRSEALEEARAIAQHEAGTWHSAYTDTVKFACNRVSDRIRAINKEAGE